MTSHAQGFDTRCIHAGEAPDPTTGAHGVPLYQNVTYAFETSAQVADMRSGARPHFTYSPRGNPTVRCFEAKMANLEGVETAVALNSGMAAISGALLAVAAGGGHIVASDQLYDLARSFLVHELPRLGASATLVDTANEREILAAITPQTCAIYVEPFSNPFLKVTDVRHLAEIAKTHELTLIVDNTFLSPALFRPAEVGADLIVHSATKYLSGNGQVQGGIVAGPRRLVDPIRERSLLYGASMPPFAAWILLSGAHTLALRVARHSENAMHIARMLHAHPAVAHVNYPGLPTHAGHEVASSLVGGDDDRYGGMVSFTLRGGAAAVAPFIDGLELCTIAVSLGDCSTLIWPWHSDDLVRVSIGLENAVDIASDIQQSLDTLVTHIAAD